MKKLLKNKKGFTLIELIVVIAILGVLAALALPTFNGMIDQSKQEVADANARTAYTAARAYIAINDVESKTTLTKDDLSAFLGQGYNAKSVTADIDKSNNSIKGVVIVDENGKTGRYPEGYELDSK